MNCKHRIKSLVLSLQHGQLNPHSVRNVLCEHWWSSIHTCSWGTGFFIADRQTSDVVSSSSWLCPVPFGLTSLQLFMTRWVTRAMNEPWSCWDLVVYWPCIHGEVKDYIDNCEWCTMGHALVIHTTSGHLLASCPLKILAIRLHKDGNRQWWKRRCIRTHRRLHQVLSSHPHKQPRSCDNRQSVGLWLVSTLWSSTEDS